jgi:hypothetical protein
VEETGRNSVTPSTTPRITALIESEIMMGSVTCGKSRVLLAYSHARRNVKNKAPAPSIWAVWCSLGAPDAAQHALFGVVRC